jgi:hypothetical protein
LLAAPIDVTPVTDLYYHYYQQIVLDLVHNAIDAHPDSISLFPRKLLTPRATRLMRQTPETLNNSGNILPGKTAKILCDRFPEDQPISFHGPLDLSAGLRKLE